MSRRRRNRRRSPWWTKLCLIAGLVLVITSTGVYAGTVAVADDDAASVQWVEPSAALAHGLAFDHADIIAAALARTED